MSKRKIDETVTEARTARAKRSKSFVAPEAESADAAQSTSVEPKTRGPKEELVVFAFRLKAEERDQIHRAAGAAKASRFIRTLAIAAARGDVKTVSEITKSVQQELTTTS